MTASRRPGDRLTACPSCGRDVRVTDDELVVGRSFCAACGQRFAVESKTVGESPFRALATIHADGTRAPDARIAVRPDGAIDVFARSATKRTAIGLGGMALSVACLASLVWALSLVSTPYWGFLLMLAVSLPSVWAAAWAAAGSRERIRLDADTLVLATGPLGLRKRRIPVRDIDRISVEPGLTGNVLSMTLRSGEKVGIAASYPVPAQAAAWLHSRLTDMVPGAALPHCDEDRADLVLARPQPPTARIQAGPSSLMIRHWLGHDDLEVRDGALWHRKKGLLRGAWQRTPLTQIRSIQVEVSWRARCRVRVERTGGKPLFIGKGLGHDTNAISWLVAWLRREIDAAAKSEVRALPESA